MANPALKNGYFSIANELAEQFARVNITGQQWRIIWILLRKTWGFKNGERRKDWDWISITQFEKLTGMKRANVYNTLKSLLAKRLILKQENLYKFNQNYNEWLLAKRLTVLAKSITPVSQKHNRGVSQLATYKRKYTKENITKEIIYSEQSSQGKDINDLISLFKPINPSYKQLYANKTQRACLARMIKEHSLEEITKVIQILPETNSQPYSPTITTPLQLENKMGALMAWYKRNQLNQAIKIS